MTGGQTGTVIRELRRIMNEGTSAASTDAELLERFVSRRDGASAAFAMLVERHGPMVLGVCRRVLNNSHDAEDAFQATFLVLVRRARSIRVDGSLGRWLFGVSYRVAIKARTVAARRRSHEQRAEAVAAFRGAIDVELGELRAVLDEELNRLPEKYRAPVVLCHLQGLTHEDAAEVLNWPVGTVRGRLSRARDRLRSQLVRRGVTPTSGHLPLAALFSRANSAIPTRLVDEALRSATAYAANSAPQFGLVSGSAAAFAKRVLRTTGISKTRTIGSALVSSLSLVVGAGTLPCREQHDDGKIHQSPRGPIQEDARGSSGRASSDRTRLSEPKLKIKLAGDDRRYADSEVTYSITLENPGTAPARNVCISATIPILGRLLEVPSGAKYDSSSRQLRWTRPQLEPGENEKVRLEFRMRLHTPGVCQVAAEASAHRALSDRSEKTTSVVGAVDLDLKVTGSKREIKVGDGMTYKIRIQNLGAKDAAKIAVTAWISENFQPNATVNGTNNPECAKYDPDSNEVTFPRIDTLAQGKDVELGIKGKKTRPGDVTCRVFLRHADEGDKPLQDIALTRGTLDRGE